MAKYIRQASPYNTQIVALGIDTYLKMLLHDNFVVISSLWPARLPNPPDKHSRGPFPCSMIKSLRSRFELSGENLLWNLLVAVRVAVSQQMFPDICPDDVMRTCAAHGSAPGQHPGAAAGQRRRGQGRRGIKRQHRRRAAAAHCPRAGPRPAAAGERIPSIFDDYPDAGAAWH